MLFWGTRCLGLMTTKALEYNRRVFLSRPYHLLRLADNCYTQHTILSLIPGEFQYFTSTELFTRRCSVKKVLSKMPQNSQENTYAGVSFLLKLAWGLYLKKRLRHRCFPVSLQNFKEYLFIEHLRWLPLHLLTQNITDHKRFSRHEIYQYKYILCGMIFEYDF